MVIFSVDVVGYGSANGYKLCAGNDGEKPASRNSHFQQIAERNPGFNADSTSLPIVIKDAIERGAVQYVTIAVQAGVAVASSHAVGQERLRFGAPQGFLQLVTPVDRRDPSVLRFRIPAPGLISFCFETPGRAFEGFPIRNGGYCGHRAWNPPIVRMATDRAPRTQLVRSRRAKSTGS